ncbi:MAG: ARPP-1 family domain-containing protein, partial [Planctomycetota bacterium]
FGDYVVSGPYEHSNLAVYLIHGRDRLEGKEFLTLEEALEGKLVVVHETGNVNTLSIQNLSPDKEVYVQSGDIVKGGKQDRVIASDFIVPAKSGRMPISSFCVERGRWSPRGAESAIAFSASKEQLATKALKLAARMEESQSSVWREVAKAQADIAANISPGAEDGDAAGAGTRERIVVVGEDMRGLERQITVQLGGQSRGSAARSSASPTSLQLTLEKGNVKDAVAKYVGALSGTIDGRADVIGFAFAINGKPNSADVYASGSLFRKLWPKLLKASAIEAVAELEKGAEVAHPAADALVDDLLEMEEGAKASEKTVSDRVKTRTVEGEKAILFETRDAASPDEVIHRSMLSK